MQATSNHLKLAGPSHGLPTLSRDLWETHPNFPDHVLLLGSHKNFRMFNRMLIDETLEGADLATVEFRFRQWIGAMRSHENYEERKLYPFLAKRFRVPSDNGAIAEAVQGHEALHDAFDEVIDAFAAADSSRVVETLRTHAAVLDAHLDQEEEMVIPALLELSREEFWEYYYGSLPQLLRSLAERGY